MDIATVPETIQRADLVNLIRSLGIDPAALAWLRVDNGAVTAGVYALDENGRKYVAGNDVARHELTIRVVDGD